MNDNESSWGVELSCLFMMMEYRRSHDIDVVIARPFLIPAVFPLCLILPRDITITTLLDIKLTSAIHLPL